MTQQCPGRPWKLLHATISHEHVVDLLRILRENDSMPRSLELFEEENRNTEKSLQSKIQPCLEGSGWPTAFVAETYGWLQGRPAICISALGPGAFNFCFISKA